MEWLKKYIFLQQTRLKNTFQCDIHIEQDIYLFPHINYLKELLHSGRLIELVEEQIGELQ